MSRNRHCGSIPIGSALLLALSCSAAFAQTPQAWITQPGRTHNLHSPAAIRSVVIAPQLQHLHAQSDMRQLQLPLPDGSSVLASVQRVQHRDHDRLSWFGHIAGDPDSHVVLTREGEHLAGFISNSTGIFEISPAAGGTVLMQHDSSRFPECGGAPLPPPELQSSTGTGTATQSQHSPQPDGATVQMDALIVFSPGAVANLGGTQQAHAFAQSAVDLANLTYTNSNMVARLHLAGVRFTTRADSGNSGTDLSWLRGNTEVAAWRNETGADMVGMISEFSNSCGQGYLMTTNSASFATSAFQVSARSCAIGNLTYPHEHGHNMGFAHNPEDSGSAVTPYAYAHWHNGQYRTVMSYANPCTSGCTRRPYFSNPDILFSGLPTGVEEERDNARAGDLTAPTIANFRAPAQVLHRDGFE